MTGQGNIGSTPARTVTVRTSLSADELMRLIQGIWDELGSDPKARERAESLGVNFDALDFEKTCPISVDPGAAGIDPFTAGILVSFGTSLTAGALIELFKGYVVPRLREKRGNDAIDDD